MFSLICVWINGWVNNREAGDLRRYRDHYDVPVMGIWIIWMNKYLFNGGLHKMLCKLPLTINNLLAKRPDTGAMWISIFSGDFFPVSGTLKTECCCNAYLVVTGGIVFRRNDSLRCQGARRDDQVSITTARSFSVSISIKRIISSKYRRNTMFSRHKFDGTARFVKQIYICQNLI